MSKSIYLTDWYVRRITKQKPGVKPEPPEPPTLIRGVIASGSNEQEIANSEDAKRRALRQHGVKEKFETYTVVKVQIVKKIGESEA